MLLAIIMFFKIVKYQWISFTLFPFSVWCSCLPPLPLGFLLRTLSYPQYCLICSGNNTMGPIPFKWWDNPEKKMNESACIPYMSYTIDIHHERTQKWKGRNQIVNVPWKHLRIQQQSHKKELGLVKGPFFAVLSWCTTFFSVLKHYIINVC